MKALRLPSQNKSCEAVFLRMKAVKTIISEKKDVTNNLLRMKAVKTTFS